MHYLNTLPETENFSLVYHYKNDGTINIAPKDHVLKSTVMIPSCSQVASRDVGFMIRSLLETESTYNRYVENCQRPLKEYAA